MQRGVIAAEVADGRRLVGDGQVGRDAHEGSPSERRASMSSRENDVPVPSGRASGSSR